MLPTDESALVVDQNSVEHEAGSSVMLVALPAFRVPVDLHNIALL